MGSACTSLFSRKKTKKQTQMEYSPRTTREMDNARRTGKLIYPPLSSIPKEEPKRSLTSDGRPLYQSVAINSSGDDQNRRNYYDERDHVRSSFTDHHNQHNDGTFAVLARYPTHHPHVYHI